MNELRQYEPSGVLSTVEVLMNNDLMLQAEKISNLMAGGTVMVPKHLQGKQPDCFAIVLQALQWGMSPFAVAQKTHLVNGVLGYEAQLVNAVIQSSGLVASRFYYEYKGADNSLQCRVGAIIQGEEKITWGEWLASASVQVKNSPLWKTNPQQQLGYLQVKNWARLYCPGAIMGVYSQDELLDQPSTEKEINPITEGRKSSKPKLKPEPEAEVIEAETVVDIQQAQEPEKPELPFWPDEIFNTKKLKWINDVESKKISQENLLAFIQSKGQLTQAQKDEFNSWFVIDNFNDQDGE
jgi:hypothetical protein